MTTLDTSFIGGIELTPTISSNSLKFKTENGMNVYSPISGSINDITDNSITVNDGEYLFQIYPITLVDLRKGQTVNTTILLGKTKSNSAEVKIYDRLGTPVDPKPFLPKPKDTKNKEEKNKEKSDNNNSSSSYKDIAPEEDIMGHVIKAYNQPVGQIAKALSTGVKRVFGLKEEIERIKKLLK